MCRFLSSGNHGLSTSMLVDPRVIWTIAARGGQDASNGTVKPQGLLWPATGNTGHGPEQRFLFTENTPLFVRLKTGEIGAQHNICQWIQALVYY
jgi:hypothetical protein